MLAKKVNNSFINSLLVLQNFTTARKKRQHSFDILKAFFRPTLIRVFSKDYFRFFVL